VAISAMPLLMALASPATATESPSVPECIEVHVLPDDATLPWLLVCRP
jgi:acid phosphatase class B